MWDHTTWTFQTVSSHSPPCKYIEVVYITQVVVEHLQWLAQSTAWEYTILRFTNEALVLGPPDRSAVGCIAWKEEIWNYLAANANTEMSIGPAKVGVWHHLWGAWGKKGWHNNWGPVCNAMYLFKFVGLRQRRGRVWLIVLEDGNSQMTWHNVW